MVSLSFLIDISRGSQSILGSILYEGLIPDRKLGDTAPVFEEEEKEAF